MSSFKMFVHNNSLSLAVFGIFFCALIGMSVTGWRSGNEDLRDHHQPQLSYVAYVQSGEFIEGVFENWESEFLQMWALAILTIYLYQKGSSESKPLRGSTAQDTSSRYSMRSTRSWRAKIKALKHFVYSHSLGLALLALFMLSFWLHAVGGAIAYSEDAQMHGGSTVSTVQYIGTSQFWYESLQNWQSEFLAIGALIVLSIKLRERGSPESKPVGRRYDHQTG